MKQTEKIKKHLDEHGSITALEAMNKYGIMRLASRMSDLKKEGYRFISDRITVKNREDEVCTIAIYRKLSEH